MTELLPLSVASLFAGFVDSIVGGGGLILVPAMFSVFPSAPPATLLGTNKGAAVCGTAWAAARYVRHVDTNWSSLLPAAAAAMAGSGLGAYLLTRLAATDLRKAIPVILVGVLLYTLAKKDLGRVHALRLRPLQEALAASVIGLTIGFYDGFFGPGTGSFFTFLLVRVLGYDFLHATAGAKLLNTATNVAALVLFVSKGHIWWDYALVMGVTNVLGSLLGTHLAMRHGAGFVRVAFLIVVSALILKTGSDAYGASWLLWVRR